MNQDILIALTLGTVPATNFSKICNSFAPPAPGAGTAITLHKVGQYFYYDITFDNQIAVSLTFDNLSGVNNYNISISLQIDTYE